MKKTIFSSTNYGTTAAGMLLLAMALLSFNVARAQCTPTGDQTSYGQDQWTGYVYTYTDDTPYPNAPTNPFQNYVGHISQAANFELNLVNDPISGADVCGSYADDFAVRYKMSKNYIAGLYSVHVHGDDGFRLSMDGGATWVTNLSSWQDQGINNRTINYNHPGGTIDFVLEYYEEDGQSIIAFNMEYYSCNSTAPTTISGNTALNSCNNSTTTLTASGGVAGFDSHYEWFYGPNENNLTQITNESASLTVSPSVTTTYWVRRMAVYECQGPTERISVTVTVQLNAAGDPTVFGDNSWIVYGYREPDTNYLIENYKGYYTQNIDSATNLGFDTDAAWNRATNPTQAATWQGCTLNDGYFSFIHKRRGFACGEYQIIPRDWDDNIRIYVDGQLIFSHEGWSGSAPQNNVVATLFLDADTEFEVTINEWGGDANAQVDIVPVSTQPAAITGITTICPGSSTTLTAVGGLLGTQGAYQWGTGAMGQNIISGQTGSSITVAPAQNTTYWVRVVFPDCNMGTGALATVSVQNTWTGAQDTDWNNPANWTCGVPTLAIDVVIPDTENKTTVSNGTMHAASLVLQNGSQLTINTGGTLQVENAVNVNTGASLTVQNNAALVQVNNAANTGVITAVRNSNPLYKLDYTLWGTPVAGQQLKAFSPNTLNNRFYTYAYNWATSQSANIEAYFPETHTNDFVPGKAYLIRMPDAISGSASATYASGNTSYTHEGNFNGTPNNGDITVPVAITSLQNAGTTISQSGHYMALGNPYASPISVAQFFAQNSNILEPGNGIYFWRKRNNTAASSYAHLTLMGYTQNQANGGDMGGNGGEFYYGNEPDGTTDYNAGWIISPGQGFIVKVKAGLSGSEGVTFTNSMRLGAPVANGQPFFRTLNTNDADAPALSRLWLNLTNTGTAFSQAAIGYMEGATTGLDYGYDGLMLSDGTAKLYSKAAASNLAIQARPAFETTDVVRMGFAVTTAGQYTLSLDHMDGIFSGSQNVYLKDNLVGSVTSLKQAGYTFTTEAGTFDGRFEVIYMPQGQLGTQTPNLANMVMVYQQNGTINISTGTAQMTSITLYDIRGRKLYYKDGINATEASVSNLSIAKGVIIVEINTVNGKVSKKIIY